MTSTYWHDDDELRVEVEVVEVTSSAPRPDPSWRHIDEAGHPHAWVGSDLPTLQWIIDKGVWCDECHERHDEGHWECLICGEHISPGMRPASPYREFLPGMRHCYLNDEPISPDEAQRLLAAWRGEA